MFEEFKETLRRVLLAKYSIGFIDGYETGYEVGYKEGRRRRKKRDKKVKPRRKNRGTVERRYSNGKDWHRRQT